jgi:hypothetical protein
VKVAITAVKFLKDRPRRQHNKTLFRLQLNKLDSFTPANIQPSPMFLGLAKRQKYASLWLAFALLANLAECRKAFDTLAFSQDFILFILYKLSQ